MSREFSAGAVVFYKNGRTRQIEYLLLRYAGAGHWDFPKGHIEEGEHKLHTVRREVVEETGIRKVRIIPGFTAHHKYSFRDYPRKKETDRKTRREWIFKVVTFYVAQAFTKSVRLSREHKDYRWLPYGLALRQITYRDAKYILKQAHAFLQRKSISGSRSNPSRQRSHV